MSRPIWKPTQTSSASWAIKGVHETTREAVREAAADAEMLIGDWVDQALREAARAALHPDPPPATQADVATLRQELAELKAMLQVIAELKAMLQAIAERAERAERHDRPVVRHVLVEKKRPSRSPLRRDRGGDGDRDP